jgi:hypothetical protein
MNRKWEDDESTTAEEPQPENTPESGDSDGDGPIVLDGDDDNEP